MDSNEKKERYVVARTTSLRHALRGISVFVRVTPNFWVHFLTVVVVFGLGALVGITRAEWMFLIVSNGAVFAAEAFNTAIEINMNLTNPGQHPMVRDTKDIAAAAVFIAGIVSWVIDILVFIPHV